MFSEWVHRRVETIEFPNAEVVRRRMSVDFSMLPSDFFREGEVVYVPLMILRKAVLRNFDLRDESGLPLQMLTTGQNGRVATLGLDYWLWSGAQNEAASLDAALLRTVGEANPQQAYLATARELTGGILAAALRELPASEPTRLAIRGLIKELAGGFLLLVPMGYQPEVRKLVKFSYDASRRQSDELDFGKLIEQATPGDRAALEAVFGRPDSNAAGRRYRQVRNLLAQAGLAARLEDIEDVQLGWSQSYHVELVPPGEMRVAEATIEPREQPPLRDNNRFRPHMHVRDQPRDSVGQVSLSLHAQRDALVSPLAFSAAIIATVLAVLPGRLESGVDFQTLAALLVLPSALAAFYVRSSEHSYVTGALRGLRLIAVVPVIAGLWVLGMLGLGFLDLDRNGHLVNPGALVAAEWAARLAVGAGALLVTAFVAPAGGVVARAVARKAEAGMESRPGSAQKAVGIALVVLGVAAYVAVLGIVFWLVYSVLSI